MKQLRSNVIRADLEAFYLTGAHHLLGPIFLHLHARDIDIITMDELHARLCQRDFARRFARFTFDDGYRDNRNFALPVMMESKAPFTVYVTSDCLGPSW
jgi:peptidoglycan/xylan/chitin deacetylase (PgdA/CDA1 family)